MVTSLVISWRQWQTNKAECQTGIRKKSRGSNQAKRAAQEGEEAVVIGRAAEEQHMVKRYRRHGPLPLLVWHDVLARSYDA